LNALLQLVLFLCFSFMEQVCKSLHRLINLLHLAGTSFLPV